VVYKTIDRDVVAILKFKVHVPAINVLWICSAGAECPGAHLGHGGQPVWCATAGRAGQ